MAFENYKGSIKLGAGLTPAAEGFPLMQTSDIQAAEDGTRLDAFLRNLQDSGLFIGTMSAYEEAYAAGQIAKGTIVIIDEDETTAILGKAILGKMILGKD